MTSTPAGQGSSIVRASTLDDDLFDVVVAFDLVYLVADPAHHCERPGLRGGEAT
jgi:hypothetical protein